MRPPSFGGEENGREGRAVVTVVVVQSGESSVSEEKQRTGHDIPYASLDMTASMILSIFTLLSYCSPTIISSSKQTHGEIN